jgi:hypothetical protein
MWGSALVARIVADAAERTELTGSRALTGR